MWDAIPKSDDAGDFQGVLSKRAYRQKPGQSAGGGPLPPFAFRAILGDFGRFLWTALGNSEMLTVWKFSTLPVQPRGL